MRGKRYVAITGPRDDKGRMSFTMFWLDLDGPWRSEPSNTDDMPVGYRRAQCFHARVEEYIERGAVLVDNERDAEKLGHTHPDMSKPIRTLRCCCCDERTRGRQWHNRDTGHGVCAACVKYMRDAHALDSTSPRFEHSVCRLFGIEGVHWNIKEDT